MKAYYMGIEIREIIGYFQMPENVREIMGDMIVAIMIGAMSKPLFVQADEIVIK